MKWHSTLRIAAVAAVLFLAACASVPQSEDNTARWISHPQFHAARVAAPDLMRDILETTTRLEAEIQRASAK